MTVLVGHVFIMATILQLFLFCGGSFTKRVIENNLLIIRKMSIAKRSKTSFLGD